YDAHINIEHFDLGRLLKDTAMLGQLTVNTDIKGQGLTDSTIHAQLKTVVEEAVFKKYAYKNLIVEGTILKKSFERTSSINDTNLAFNYSVIIDMDAAHPRYNFIFNLIGADLKALQLSPEDLR